MRVIYSNGSTGGGGLWMLPLLGGFTLIAVGVAIVFYPPILAYAVAFLMISSGMSLLGVAFSWRRAFHHSASTAPPEWEVVDSPRDRTHDSLP